jgi:hypothetical protein
MMRRLAVVLSLFALPACFAQEGSAARDGTLIPQTVYVGDRARLIVALDGAATPSGFGPAVVDRAEALPKTEAVHIHRVEIEPRQDGVRGIIDFTAFVPGNIELPGIDAAGLRLTGLQVHISSVLEENDTELSPPEGTLVAPGTFSLIYGALFIAAALVAGALFAVFRGLPAFREYRERRRRGLAARSMRRVIGRLESEGDRLDAGTLLSVLFDELRSYLTYRTGVNCHALTAREFPLALGDSAVVPGLPADDLAFLERLFRQGDEVRFGARRATREELDEALRGVSALLERTEAAVC